MRRKKIAALLAGTVVVSSASGWLASGLIRSPAEVAARTAPPTASPILVPAEMRVLSTDIVTRGVARFGAPQQLSLVPSALKTDAPIITSVTRRGRTLTEGDIALTTSGRPTFLLAGHIPMFRDLGPGLEGDDVRQLEEALARLGFDPGPADGRYDSLTERAVTGWYRAAGFRPTTTTPSQLAAIRSLETELASSRLDILSARSAVALSEAELVAARAAVSRAVAASGTAGDSVAAARAEANAGNLRAQAEVDKLQELLGALRSGKPGTPAEIDAATYDLAAAEASATSTRIAGQRAVAEATAALNTAASGLATATTEAHAANLAAALDLSEKQRALDDLRASGTATPAQLSAAEDAVAVATATADAVRARGAEAVAAAQLTLDTAPAALQTAREEADAANAVANLDVANKRRLLDALRTGTPGTPSEIASATADLGVAVASREATRLAGQQLVAAAYAGRVGASLDVQAARAAAAAAEVALANTKAGLTSRGVPTTLLQLEVGLAKRQAGVQVPADEVIFVSSAPIRVAEVTAALGAPAVGPILTATNSVVVIDSSLPLEEAPLVKPGMAVTIDEPQLGINATGVITRIADTPGTRGVDGFHIYVEIAVDAAPANLVGASLRLTVPIKSTGGPVLAVPVAAVSLAPDGTSQVVRDDNGVLRPVAVVPGVSANGFVAVVSAAGGLQAGDLVVAGFESPVPAGGG